MFPWNQSSPRFRYHVNDYHSWKKRKLYSGNHVNDYHSKIIENFIQETGMFFIYSKWCKAKTSQESFITREKRQNLKQESGMFPWNQSSPRFRYHENDTVEKKENFIQEIMWMTISKIIENFKKPGCFSFIQSGARLKHHVNDYSKKS